MYILVDKLLALNHFCSSYYQLKEMPDLTITRTTVRLYFTELYIILYTMAC